MLGIFGALRAPCLLGVGLVLMQPQAASAYSDPGRFALDATRGGGGGRYFTGSLLDGFDCSECHRGGDDVLWVFEGLPEASVYKPGETYTVSGRWAPDAPKNGLAFEALTINAENAGVTSLLSDTDLTDFDRCDDGRPATRLIETPDRRAIVVTEACGAARGIFRWQAPTEAQELWIHAVVVASNNDGGPEGDGSAREAQLRVAAIPKGEVQEVTGACGVSAARSSWCGGWLSVLILVALLRLKAVAHRSEGERARTAASGAGLSGTSRSHDRTQAAHRSVLSRLIRRRVDRSVMPCESCPGQAAPTRPRPWLGQA